MALAPHHVLSSRAGTVLCEWHGRVLLPAGAIMLRSGHKPLLPTGILMLQWRVLRPTELQMLQWRVLFTGIVL